LTVTGDPESTSGATWTFRGMFEGVSYDIQGILLKPRGAGPFPAVVLSHGYGGSANTFARGLAREMVQWGLVCVATNYTHASGVPPGAPGTANEPGASVANIQRAHAAREVLTRLGYVDLARVAAHGHSMGAFVTAAFVSAYPSDFRAASHTAGGIRGGGSAQADAAAPTESQVMGIRTPYQLHHGDIDTVVALPMDQALDTVLQRNGVTHEFHVYPGVGHGDVSQHPDVLARVKAWYRAHGVL
jgi:dienelactone hydrolase